MTILNSKFDIIGRDPHSNARAGLLVVLPVYQGGATWVDPSTGSPVAGSIVAGTIVAMNDSGEAVVADNTTTRQGAYPSLLFTTIDGDTDFDGAFVHKITCIQGGAEFKLGATANVSGTLASFTPGKPLMVGTSATAGKWLLATSNKQIYGYVGQDGYDSTTETVSVIVPQGVSPMMP